MKPGENREGTDQFKIATDRITTIFEKFKLLDLRDSRSPWAAKP